MRKHNVRVIVASEYSKARDFLREAVEAEEGNIVIGQARDAGRALELVKSLRPDVAIIDSSLPHVIGLDAVPLSRVGGLDTAQAISGEVPNTKVILLPSLDKETVAERVLGLDNAPFFSRKTNGSHTPFKLHDLFHELVTPEGMVFADIEVKPREITVQKGGDTAGKVIFFGGLAALSGWFFILTVFLAPVGIVLTLAGLAVMGLGLTGRLLASLKARFSMQGKPGKKGDAES
ncbi:MAG: response regulator [Dehalococcoidales bacterium]|nr:response regulator [Dehalococcoidales bacterium]